MEALSAAAGWLLHVLLVAVIPAVAIAALAVLVGVLRTALLLIAFPLLAAATSLDRAAQRAGHAVPAPRIPRPAEVTR